MVKHAPCISCGLSLPSRAFFRQFGQFLADLFQAFLIHVFDYWNNQAVRRVCCETDVEVVFQHQVVAIQRGVEFREGFQRSNRGFNDERQWGQFYAFAFPFFVSCLRNSSNSVMSASSCTVT